MSTIKPVWSPVMTPFLKDFSVDDRSFTEHCQWLLKNDVGLAIFGTNSEANSLPVKEKIRLMERLVDAGIAGDHIMPGTGTCNLEDSVELTKKAVQIKSAGVLMLPPFYYKGVSDDGLYAYFSEIVERVADSNLRIYLYHIPAVSHVPISLDLIKRLIKQYPENFLGIKDSGGDWSFTISLIKEFSEDGFNVFAGSERFLLDTLRAGGSGCISATANVNPSQIAKLAQDWSGCQADSRQSDLIRIRDIFESYPLIPGMKAVKANATLNHDWRRVRPPLVSLDSDSSNSLNENLNKVGFRI